MNNERPRSSLSTLASPAVFGFASMALAILAFVAWGSLAPLSGAIVATGFVKTEQYRKTIQHLEGGIIKRLLVRDGDLVDQGQPLVEFENVTADSNFTIFQELLAQETMKCRRLDQEQQLLATFVMAPDLRVLFGDTLALTTYGRENRIFQARRASLDQQTSTLENQLEAISHEQRALHAQIKADQDGVRLMTEELVMNQALIQQNFISKSRLLEVERAKTDYLSRLSEHEANLALSEQRWNDVKLRLAAIRTDYQRLATEEHKECSNRLVELTERMRVTQHDLKQKILTAPVSGKVVGARFHAPGQVASPRETLMEIVPNQEQLIVEGSVAVDAIKELHIDQPADLRFTAFKSRTTPIVTGKVVYISADSLNDKNGMPYYQVHVIPDLESLRHAGISQIMPGMAAELYIRTDSRTSFDYMFSPITDTLRKALRER